MDKIAKNSRAYSLFFVRPQRQGNLHDSAKRLMGIRRVRQVLVTEGEYGFVVMADSLLEDSMPVSDRIARAVGGRSSAAVCHCHYRRH